MRIITGEARGRKLQTPKGRSLRPTADIVKEGFFNIIGAGIRGAVFLDLFAGTGNIGIEALSRGAARADFVEIARSHRAVISANLRMCGFEDRARVMAGRVANALAGLSGKACYDYIFADPPYDYREYDNLLQRIASLDLLREDGLLAVETARRTELAEELSGLKRVRTYGYGTTQLLLYRWSDSEMECEVQ